MDDNAKMNEQTIEYDEMGYWAARNHTISAILYKAIQMQGKFDDELGKSIETMQRALHQLVNLMKHDERSCGFVYEIEMFETMQKSGVDNIIDLAWGVEDGNDQDGANPMWIMVEAVELLENHEEVLDSWLIQLHDMVMEWYWLDDHEMCKMLVNTVDMWKMCKELVVWCKNNPRR